MPIAEAITDSTTNTTGIFSKVFALQKGVGTIIKDKTNSFHHYSYASATRVSEQVGAALSELGLIANVRTEIHSVVGELVLAQTTLTLIDAETGEQMVFSSIGSGTDKGDKAAMKAATASLKYATLAAVFGATEDDPEADTKTDIRASAPAPRQSAPNLRPVAPGATKPGSAAAAQGPVPVADNQFVVTTSVDKVYAGRPTKSGKTGPGTVVAPDGTRYDTFDTGLLEIAKKAMQGGKNVNVMFVYNDQYKRNTIVEHGLSLFGEPAVPTETAVGEEY